MSSLEQKVHSLREQFKLNSSARELGAAIDDCQDIYGRFSSLSERLALLQRQSSSIAALPVDAPENLDLKESFQQQISKTLASFGGFFEVWQKNKQASRQDDSLENSRVALENLVVQLEGKLESCWNKWTEQLYSQCMVEKVILDSQREIPGCERLYDEYIELQGKFKSLARQVPETVWPLRDLMDLKNRMEQIRGQMQFELPESVKRFFKILNQRGRTTGVPLSEMDKDTFCWLLEHDLLGQFSVERSRKLF
ncbi:hypothetical protein PA17_01684 [Pseudomonas aeruginosa]|uniref:hypothetical protein n=1 Tax=Pseudomonas aeruginosa TaxID=287 RepID=UPI000DFCADB1|nr:hypothetical protein [Pseudomonas aeruginosa]RCM97822.1 hypothetical protein PA17_01684 [Pseudomonas aeruginosa]